MRITGIVSVLLTLAIALNGCAVLKDTASEPPVFTEDTPISAPPEETAGTETASEEALRDAYQFALQQIAFEHVLPDGTELFFDPDFGFIEENDFALADVDGDGMMELALRYTTAPMAGMRGLVYGWDPESGALRQELDVFPEFTCFPGGLVKASWSHNHTYGMDFWPYTLMRFDPESGVYQMDVSVCAWDQAVSDVDQAGNPFPADKDPEGTGVVYLLTRGETETILSSGEFALWEQETFPGEPLELSWQKLTEENIRSVTD